MSTRWLVVGAGGMLGQDVLGRLAAVGETSVVGLRSAELDVTDAGDVEKVLGSYRPELVVNCAAYTKVDDAESHEDEALRINGDGPRNLAGECAKLDARLLHVSTDYVFAGNASEPYDEEDEPAPRTAYGRTKLAGERAVLSLLPDRGAVVRTAWLYGAGGPNFVRTMIRLESEKETLDVVDDQHGQPTWTVDVAERLVGLGIAMADGIPDARGVFHATSSGETTWCGLTREIFQLLGADPARVRPTTTDKFPRPAPRPAYSVLAHRRWFDVGLRPIQLWQDALAAAFDSLT